MNKIKKIFTTFVISLLLLGNAVVPVGAVAPWNVTGNFEFTFFLNPDTSVNPYAHHVTLNQSGASVTGDGGYPTTGGDTYHWNITSGTQIADALNINALYDLGAAGSIMGLTGNIAPDGTVTGTWNDDYTGDRTGNWSITKGISVPQIHTPSNGAIVTQSALVKVDWTDSVGSNPPFEYQYEAYSDAGYTIPVYSSSWLSNSEIPTLGTPIGDYYLRVKARNSISTESNWSNGAGNPYHITVIVDPVNPFDVPAQCDQNTVYNKIEGTNSGNVINGSELADLILAKGGGDVVDGKGGNDCIVGGDGGDYLKGGDGNDVILGGNQGDVIQGGNGEDTLYGQDGGDAISGGANNDTLYGGAGADTLSGDAGSDTLDGQGGSDFASGGANTDTCTAEAEISCEL